LLVILLYLNLIGMKSYNDSIHNIVYNTDASHLLQNVSTEVFIPENKDEVIDIVKKAISENKKVICRWWWTNLVWNCLPEDNYYVIDLSRLNSILRIWENSVVVQPWITNDQLNEKLSEKWLIFPVVLWSHAWAEIWWMIATNWAWMRAIKYWKMEERVEELEVLYVDKEKTVKVERLAKEELKDFLWAEWKIWIVLESKLKIIPIPWKISVDFKSFSTSKEALDYVKEIKNQNIKELSALEIINPQVAWYLGLKNNYYVLAEYEDINEWSIKDENEIRDIREKRDACYAVSINAWYDQIEDPQISLDKAEEFFARFESNQIPIFWHIWIWVLHPHFKSSQKELVKEMYELVNRLWWKVSWEHWIGKKKEEYLLDEIITKNKLSKDKRDPNNIFWF